MTLIKVRNRKSEQRIAFLTSGMGEPPYFKTRDETIAYHHESAVQYRSFLIMEQFRKRYELMAQFVVVGVIYDSCRVRILPRKKTAAAWRTKRDRNEEIPE